MTDGYKIKRVLTWVNGEEKQIYPAVKPIYKGEYIEYKMNADSNGRLYVPTAGVSTSGSQNCPYNWKVSVDGGAGTTYSGTGSSKGSITLSGYTAGSSHTIKIVPTTEAYEWARAYCWFGTSGATYLTEIIYDSSYMGYAVSATDTGNRFKNITYYGCSNLTNPADEYLPDTVTTIGNRFRNEEYEGCSSLTYPSEELLPSSVTSIGDYFRFYQYLGCSSITYSAEEVLPSSIVSIGVNFRDAQYNSCTALTEIKGWKDLSIGNSGYRSAQYYGCNSNKTVKVLSNVGYNSYNQVTLDNSYVTSVSVPSAYLNNFKNSSNYPWVGITDSKFIGY